MLIKKTAFEEDQYFDKLDKLQNGNDERRAL